MLPLKTTIEDFDALGGYLKTQVGWVAVSKIKSTIDPKHADNRKLEAGRFIGFLDRDGTNVRLAPGGLEYATSADDSVKSSAMLKMLLSATLYADTVHWMHFSKHAQPTRTLVGNYWHDHHADKLEGAQGSALTDAVIFFFRLAGAAGLGKFVRGGGANPEAYFNGDAEAIGKAATTEVSQPDSGSTEQPAEEQSGSSDGGGQKPPSAPPPPPPPAPPAVSLQTSPAVHVNIEIHIAADATASTVEEIFKNMRKYVLNGATAEDGK